MVSVELFNPAQRRIIESLLLCDKTLSELVAELGISKPGASKHLKKLEALHLVTGTYEHTTAGRTIRYHLQPFHLVFSLDPLAQTILSFQAREPLDADFLLLGSVPQKEFRQDIRAYLKALQTISWGRLTVLLYGSAARGEAHRKSDIDLLFIRDHWSTEEKQQVLQLCADASQKTTHQAKPLFVESAQFESMAPSLKKEIKDHGIILVEQGSPWETIRRTLQQYKSITS
ncbi:MAG: nucleotidyltransferase domain-containing protein [Candidatus Thermoplasmatota archaeon]|nr:nucleotidyltransferase domain-containing protein [Candidatus Thermoplasmatota archaeon]